nr:PREDICTED: nociceptin receptor-like [Lepisosteus oculatus]
MRKIERYIAICIPLRHADISTPRRALACILIIFALGSLPHFIVLFILVASVPVSFYKERTVCSVVIMVRHKWQSYLISTLYQFYFFVMTITIAFTFLKILATAKAASADNRKSVLRGRRTVILHALQLLLCLIEMWCPFVEAAVFEIDVGLFVNLRYFNFIAFILSPRCLSPLVYGLRDEKFFLAFKYYTSFGLNKTLSTVCLHF